MKRKYAGSYLNTSVLLCAGGKKAPCKEYSHIPFDNCTCYIRGSSSLENQDVLCYSFLHYHLFTAQVLVQISLSQCVNLSPSCRSIADFKSSSSLWNICIPDMLSTFCMFCPSLAPRHNSVWDHFWPGCSGSFRKGRTDWAHQFLWYRSTIFFFFYLQAILLLHSALASGSYFCTSGMFFSNLRCVTSFQVCIFFSTIKGVWWACSWLCGMHRRTIVTNYYHQIKHE